MKIQLHKSSSRKHPNNIPVGFPVPENGSDGNGLVLANVRQVNILGEDEGGPEVIGRKQQIMVTVDGLNKQMGQSTIRLEAAGTKHTWSMRRVHLSNRFTIGWDEILEVS